MSHVFHLIPHTHWDREWYLTGAAFLARLVPTIDDLVARLESDPEFRAFLLDGQTVLLEDYLRVRPEARPDVRALVRAGRLEVGPWYVLADEQIPSGESLIRNLLLGTRDAAEFGARMDVLYSPDAFGHPAVLPTLAAEFGMRWGVLWRGVGGEPGQEGDLYRWRGPDGAELLLYHLPPDGYEIGAALPADPDRLARAWPGVRAPLVARAASRHVAVFVGADHHAAHPALAELRRNLAALAPADEFRISRLGEFFQAVEADLDPHTLPILEGELRWSYRYTWTLQGVHATRAPLKRRHANVELGLERIAEPLAALAMRHDGGERRPVLRHAWRTLVRSQFHDAIGGCSSDAVTRQVERRLESAEALTDEIARTSLAVILGHDPDAVRESPNKVEPILALWNPVPRPRGGVVVADVTAFRRDILVGPLGGRIPRQGAGFRPFVLRGPEGNIPVQLLGRAVGEDRLDAPRHYPDQDEVDIVRVAFAAPAVAGFDVMTLRPRTARSQPLRGTAWARGRRLGNDLIEVALEPTGAFTLADRRTGERFTNVARLEAGGDIGDTYTYCPPAPDEVRRSRGPVALTRLAAGPLVAAVEVRWSFAAVAIRLVVSVHAGSPVVRCTYELDNAGSDFRLRLRIPTDLPEGAAVAGAQFGAVGRAAVESVEGLRETPVRTAPAHRFVARADGSRGMAVLAPGFFEYELDADGSMAVTLLRAVGALSRGALATRPGHAGWPTPTPEAQCHGRDRLQLAFCTVADADVAQISMLSRLWEDTFLPVRPVWLRQSLPGDLAETGIELEGDRLVFSALKPAEEGAGFVLRCYNPGTEPVAGAWRLQRPVSAAYRVLANEEAPQPLEIAEGGHVIRFTASPLAIVTVAVR